MWNIYGQKGIDYPEDQYDELSEKVECMLRQTMIRLIKDGKNVVIDFSFWNRDNRNFYKNIIEKTGATVELVYMKASKELLWDRLQKRNLSIHYPSGTGLTIKGLSIPYFSILSFNSTMLMSAVTLNGWFLNALSRLISSSNT